MSNSSQKRGGYKFTLRDTENAYLKGNPNVPLSRVYEFMQKSDMSHNDMRKSFDELADLKQRGWKKANASSTKDVKRNFMSGRFSETECFEWMRDNTDQGFTDISVTIDSWKTEAMKPKALKN